MYTHFMNRWDSTRNSFWFVPALMSTGALALALLCTSLDGPIERWLVDIVPWIGVSTNAARASLSAIGGAMVSIAGIVFSVMLVTLSITSSQYGSRLLRTFMSDNVTQCALGMLVGTSLFSMTSLAGIQDSVGNKSSVNVSVIVGLVLAIASLAVLVAFIHHVANTIQAPNVVAEVARDLNDSFDRLFPERIDERRPGTEITVPKSGSGSLVRSDKEGYLQAIDVDTLISMAKSDDLFLRVNVKPGDFVEREQSIIEVWPSEAVIEGYENSEVSAPADFGDSFREAINSTMIAGRRRTPRQDAECALEELVEVAVRALSPGINDPFTAISCIDYLAAALGRAAERQMPSELREDSEGTARIWARATSFENLMDTAFNPIRQHGHQCVAVAIRLVQALKRISAHATTDERKETIIRHAKKIERDFRAVIDQPEDGDDFQRAYDELTD